MALTTGIKSKPATAKQVAPIDADHQQGVAGLEQMQRHRLREAIETYRKLVHRAAAGEAMTPADYEAVELSLESMRLPALAWARDVSHCKQIADARKLELELKPLADAAAARVRQLNGPHGEIAAAEKRVRDLREELNRNANVIPSKHARAAHRQQELAAEAPHLFLPLDEAVAIRFEVRQQQEATTARAAGMTTRGAP
jgi:hypothetical protein